MSKFLDRMRSRLLPLLGYLFIRVLRWTMRIQVVNAETPDAFWTKGQNVIAAFWHGRQLMMPFAYSGKKASVLISRHRDGELIARTIRYFGFNAARGSTTRGGAAALKQLVRFASEGDDLGVTPDGPRGPKYRVQLGVVELAKLTQRPILPLAFGASKKKVSGVGMAS